MIVLKDASEYAGGGSVVALGMFDGLHAGHRELIVRARALAAELSAGTVVMTFDRHPLSVIRPGSEPPPLMSAQRRRDELSRMCVDTLVEQRFDREFAALTPCEFVDFLRLTLKPLALVAGYNYTFGAGGAGDAAALIAIAARLNIACEIVPKVVRGGRPVSSSWIRGLIASGDYGAAREMGYDAELES